MNCYELLEEVKKAKNFRSDNELAKFLGITRQSIHGIKNGGGFNDEIAIKVSEITGRELAEILLIREISCEHNEKIKAAWENISKLSGIAAGILIAYFINGNPEEMVGYFAALTVDNNIHYAKSWGVCASLGNSGATLCDSSTRHATRSAGKR